MLALSPFVYGQTGVIGAWQSKAVDGKSVTMILIDNYLVITAYDYAGKQFGYTEGGKVKIGDKAISYTVEFNSSDSSKVGDTSRIPFTVNKGGLLFTYGPHRNWEPIDDAKTNNMAGVWQITERANEGVGPLVRIHQTGPRKTLKVLSGTCFQWIAINPAVKGFYGTGGGTYTVKNGRYTENIRFFSRDNSRVGAALTFDWALNDGKWDHSGKSSKGDPMHETWERVK